MKKLLSLLGAIGLVASTSASVASCGKPQEQYQGYTNIDFPGGPGRKIFEIDPNKVVNLYKHSQVINSIQTEYNITYAYEGIQYSVISCSMENDDKPRLEKEGKELYDIYHGDLKINNYKSEGIIGIVVN